VVLPQNASKQLACRDRTVRNAVRFFGGPATGEHDDGTPGILVVSGPLFARGAVVADVSIRDVAPTLLYALGLPVGADFIGKPALRLFARDHRRSFPVREIASWGKRDPEEVQASSVDEELVEKLVALGYLQ
jgi:hypothetical protein